MEENLGLNGVVWGINQKGGLTFILISIVGMLASMLS
jgi:hypothetical protein